MDRAVNACYGRVQPVVVINYDEDNHMCIGTDMIGNEMSNNCMLDNTTGNWPNEGSRLIMGVKTMYGSEPNREVGRPVKIFERGTGGNWSFQIVDADGEVEKRSYQIRPEYFYSCHANLYVSLNHIPAMGLYNYYNVSPLDPTHIDISEKGTRKCIFVTSQSGKKTFHAVVVFKQL
jgi:hypothetical protein